MGTGGFGVTRERTLLCRRLLGGTPALAQVWFLARVLDKYRGVAGYKLVRTDTVGRLRGPQWTLDFGIAGEGDSLIHCSAADVERIPQTEHEHWAACATGLPLSANYTLMQLTRGACIDDGEVRAW